MKTSIKAALAAMLIAGGALGTGAALARGEHCEGGMRGAWHQAGAERMKERADLGLARLELALAIKPEQKADWDTFKAAQLERVSRAGERMAEHAKAERPTTALERIARMEAFGKDRQEELARARRDVEAFYGKLSDAQKKVFDAEYRDGGFGPHGRGGRMHGHGMGPQGMPGDGPAPRG